MVGEQGSLGVKYGQLKFINRITFDRANRTGNKCDYLRFGRSAAKANLDVVVREKLLKEFSIAFLPGLPGLLLQIDQSFLERTIVEPAFCCNRFVRSPMTWDVSAYAGATSCCRSYESQRRY